MELSIQHNKEKHVFAATLEGFTCTVSYSLPAPNTMSIDSTYVPTQLRGRGIAAMMVKHVLDYAQQHKLSVIPNCSYVDAYIKRHHPPA